MLDYRIRVGLVTVRRDVTARPGIFNWEKAEKRGAYLTDYVEKHFKDELISFVDLKGINPKNIMYCMADAEKTVERFKNQKVDAIFFINCNFGNEEAIAYVAQNLRKPILLWAPLDDVFESDGMRYTDSQCGLFGATRMLQRLHIPFSYIETCRVEDERLRLGLLKFFSVSCMVKNFTHMKIAQVGMRPAPFYSVIYNEGELIEKFGITVIPIKLAVILEKYNRILEERDEELERGKQVLLSKYEIDELTLPQLKKIYAFVLLYDEIFLEYGIDALSAECWTAMQLLVGAMPCAAYGILADMGYIISCESDLHGAITMALLSCASFGRKRPFFGEFTVRHPENENVELLWHCGPFAWSLRKEESPCKLVNMRQWFQVADGEYTVARMDQEDGKYFLLSGKCRSAEGPYTFGTYLWVEFDNLRAWERKLVEGPYIHHMAEIEGDYTDVLEEFCKFVPNLVFDTVKR